MRRTTSVAVVLAGLSLTTGCTAGSRHLAARPPGSTSPAAAPSPSTGPTAPTGPALARGLTGRPDGLGRPILAVKIDNTRPAHPQVGLGVADVVYLEQVEGGLTRLLAIFSSRQPAVIGPTRSARESDLELLREYGRVVVAFSGANRGVLRAVRRAPIVDGSFDVVPGAYFRDFRRRSPYNLFLRPQQLLAARRSVPARDIGLRFAPASPAGGRADRALRVRYGPYATISARYDARRHTWPIFMDGRPSLLAGGGDVAPANVIVQYVAIHKSRFRDVLGNPTPYTTTVGSGAAVVYRDGRAYAARWSRPTAVTGTRYVDAAGRDVALRPGQTWVLLAPRMAR